MSIYRGFEIFKTETGVFRIKGESSLYPVVFTSEEEAMDHIDKIKREQAKRMNSDG